MIRDALAALYTATPGSVLSLPYRWRRERYAEPTSWALGPTRPAAPA